MTDQQLAAQATAALKATTITYAQWVKNVAAGKYNPRDGSTTQWGIALAALPKIGVAPPPSGPAPPRPPAAYTPPGGTLVSTSAELEAALKQPRS